MPELHTFLIFAAASAAFLAVPGPSVIYIVSRYVGLGLLAALSPVSNSSAHELMQ